jgi:hypothetical protein
MKLVFIHGRSQEGKNPEDLKRNWESALRDGFRKANLVFPEGVKIDFPYYGDSLKEAVNQLFSASRRNDVVAKGSDVGSNDPPPDFIEFAEQLVIEMQQKNPEIASNGEIRLPSDLIDDALELKMIPLAKGPLNWKWVQAVLKVLDGKTSGELMLEKFTRDVYSYLTVPRL